ALEGRHARADDRRVEALILVFIFRGLAGRRRALGRRFIRLFLRRRLLRDRGPDHPATKDDGHRQHIPGQTSPEARNHFALTSQLAWYRPRPATADAPQSELSP